MLSFLTDESVNELNVYNLDVSNSLNFHDTKIAKEYICVKIISQECKIKHKWILKAKTAESFQAEIEASFFAHKYTFL